MVTARVRLYVLWAATLSVMGIFLVGAATTPAPVEAAEAMLADDAKTWKTLLDKKQLDSILKLQTDEINKAMVSKATFQRGFRKMQIAGHIVAALGNIGAMMFEGEEAKKAAALREAGLALAGAAKDKKFDEAKKAAETIESYPAKIAPAADANASKFGDVLPLDILMKSVSSIDSATGAAVRKDDKFKKEHKELGHQTRLLAILSVLARDHNENADWKGWCDEMRDYSGNLAREFEKSNFDGSKTAREELQKSCTACHDVYRKEE